MSIQSHMAILYLYWNNGFYSDGRFFNDSCSDIGSILDRINENVKQLKRTWYWLTSMHFAIGRLGEINKPRKI